MQNKVNCNRCRYFKITWQNQYPYCCTQLGFKSMHYPSYIVKQSSGIDCKYFEEKKKTIRFKQ